MHRVVGAVERFILAVELNSRVWLVLTAVVLAPT
jgi:hypothetical protein